MRKSAATAQDWLRAELWPIPTVAVVAAVVAGLQFPRLDRPLDERLPGWLSSIVFDGGPGAAQTVLDAVSSSLITVTSLTFSLTVVTLQLASSQFSPRLLRTFTSDLFVQATLALFLATFVYSLTVLRLVRSEDGRAAAFVPRLSVTLAFVLVVASVFMLVMFLAHLTRTIRVESMLRNVHDEASATIRAIPGPHGRERAACARHLGPTTRSPCATPTSCTRRRPGCLTWVDERALMSAASDADAVIAVDVRPGDQVIRGLPIARTWPTGPGQPLTGRAADGLHEAVATSVRCGPERTAGQDVGFGLRQLTDVVNRALSPGINDPTTALHAIGHLAALLCDLSDHDLTPRLVHDDRGVLRLVLAQPDFEELLDAAISQPRRLRRRGPRGAGGLMRLLEALAHRVPPDLHPVVDAQRRRLLRTIARQDFDDTELGVLEAVNRRTVELLVGRAT